MCGVFALFLRRPLTERDIALGRSGTAALAHRGPDHQGEWIDRARGVYLGHRRLSIIDLSAAGNQPMVADGCAISYNGEIYNYRAVREDLRAVGVHFRTAGDTEVLLKAWQQWRIDALNRVDAMFGFALWDGEVGWLAVDAFGEKQLYYAATADGIAVSSELAPLVRLLQLRPDLTGGLLPAVLALGYVPGPDTAYATVKRVMPGSVVRIERGVAGASHTYWTAPQADPGHGKVQPLSEAEIDRIRAALIESLQRRLESDVEPSLFLSSGVDSALIAALLQRELGRRVQCFTVSFPTGTRDESAGAARIASALSLPHRTLVSRPAETPTPAAILDLFGQPAENLTVLSIRQMTAAAQSAGYRMGLTGMGGDEIFAGYNKHAFLYRHRRVLGLPSSVRRLAGLLARPLRRSTTVAGFLATAAVADHERFVAIKNVTAIAALRQLSGFDEWARRTFSSRTPIELAVPRFDLVDTMPNIMLTAQDLGSMRSSFELRTPFLSRALVGAVAACDPRALLAFGQKSALRRILRRYVPDELMNSPKRGFVFPAEQFLANVSTPPHAAGVAPQLADAIWNNRTRVEWQYLAVRLALVAEMPAWAAQTASPPASLSVHAGAPAR